MAICLRKGGCKHTLEVSKSIVDLVELLGIQVVIPFVPGSQSIALPDKIARQTGREALGEELIERLSFLSALGAGQILVIVGHIPNVRMPGSAWNSHIWIEQGVGDSWFRQRSPILSLLMYSGQISN